MALFLAAYAHVLGSAETHAQVAGTPAPDFTTTGIRGPMAIGSGDALYVAGWRRFTMRAEYFAALDGSGAVDPSWPQVDGVVEAIVPDGAGGWFIGGDFTQVGGQPHGRLAHIGPGGAVDGSWTPAADRPVYELAVVGATVYAGGEFRSIDGQPRSRLAALEAVSGRLLPWNPRVNGHVGSLAAADGVVYAGGGFSRAGGAGRRGLAAFDAGTGAVSTWNPQPEGGDYDLAVHTLVASGGTLYVAGAFTTVAGQERHGLAAFETATGAVTAWNPRLGRDDLLPLVGTLAISGDTVYAGGEFDRIGSVPRANLGAIDTRTGQALPWRVTGDAAAPDVRTLAVLGDRLYIGGTFDSLAGRPRDSLAAVSATTGAPLAWDPRPNSTVASLAVGAGRVLAGGYFHGFGSQEHDRLGAIDPQTGAPLPFRAPRRHGIGVSALAARADSLFAAGRCTARDCRGSRSITHFDVRTGAQRWTIVAGRPGGLGSTYDALAVSGRRLYVGGRFHTVGGGRRENLAALDTRTGHLTTWRADTNGTVVDLLVHGRTLYLIGGFTRVDGHRRRGAAAIDLRSGRVTAWNPRVGRRDPAFGCCFVDAIAVAGGRVYLGGYFDRVGGKRRRHLVAVSRTDGRSVGRNPRFNGGVNTLAVIGGTLYAGGRFTSVSGVRRPHIAAIDAAHGTPTAWNPGADVEVFRLLATPAGLLANGGFDMLGGVNVEGLGLFPRSGRAA